MPPKRRAPSAAEAVESDEATAQPISKKSRAEATPTEAAAKPGRKSAAAKKAEAEKPNDDVTVVSNQKSGVAETVASQNKGKKDEDEEPLGPGHPGNKGIITAFLQLAVYEHKFGDVFAALGCLKVHEKLRRHVPNKIDASTGSKSLPEECRLGRGAKAQIDEFYAITSSTTVQVTPGKINRLEDLKVTANGADVPELDGQHEAALEKTIAEIKATAVEGKPLSAETVKKIEAAKAAFSSMKIPALKNILRTNQQLLSGTKDELVERCAQGSVLGALPRCPHCFGGKLRFDKEKGLYWCHGYMDDDEYKPCYFHANTCQADEWIVCEGN